MLKAVKEKYGIEKHEVRDVLCKLEHDRYLFCCEQVIVTANSLFHDHKPANSLGIASSWIKREGSVMGISGNATYIWSFESLCEMADAADAEVGLSVFSCCSIMV